MSDVNTKVSWSKHDLQGGIYLSHAITESSHASRDQMFDTLRELLSVLLL